MISHKHRPQNNDMFVAAGVCHHCSHSLHAAPSVNLNERQVTQTESCGCCSVPANLSNNHACWSHCPDPGHGSLDLEKHQGSMFIHYLRIAAHAQLRHAFLSHTAWCNALARQPDLSRHKCKSKSINDMTAQQAGPRTR